MAGLTGVHVNFLSSLQGSRTQLDRSSTGGDRGFLPSWLHNALFKILNACFAACLDRP